MDSSGVAFIECKVKRLTVNAKTSLLNKDALLRDVGILADSVIQVYKTISDYRQSKYPQLKYEASLPVFPVIVTLENWYPLGHALGVELDKMVRAKLTENGMSHEILSELSYCVASTEELETAAQIIAKVGCAAFFEPRRNDKYNGWTLDGFMRDAFPAERKAAVDLFAGTYDEILSPFKPPQAA